MNAAQQPEPRTSNGDRRPQVGEGRPEVRPDVSVWDIREVKESRWGKTIRAVIRGAGLPLGAVTVASLTIREILRTEGLDGGFKIVGVIAVIQSLVILGMATLLVGAKTNAATSKDQPDQPTDAGDA